MSGYSEDGRGYDPYNHNPFAGDDADPFTQPKFTGQVIWTGKDGSVYRIKARSQVPFKIISESLYSN